MKLEDLDHLKVGDHVFRRGRVGTVTFATHITACVAWPDGDSTVLGPYTPLEILATFSVQPGMKSETTKKVRIGGK
jgi:hypothetical protein